MKVFINLSNHRSNNWDENQINEAKKYGEIIDIDFPVVNPLADEKAISDLVNKYYDIICSKTILLAKTIYQKILFLKVKLIYF